MIGHRTPAPQRRNYILYFPAYILDLMLFFFHRVATSTLTRPTIGGTGLTTVINAILFVGFPHNGATANRT
jgi:hypothetical protein